MKKNLPVTNNRVVFSADEEIISTTDLKGAITSCNEIFKSISGFTDEELIGKNHNVIRHPDMPPAAFEDLWKHMKANKHWMGIVKNRCKNGDHYWVDAYVTPMVDNGQVSGYESVRAVPTEEQVQRAETIYQQINAGKKPKIGNFFQRLSLSHRAWLANLGAMLTGLGVFTIMPTLFVWLPMVSGVLAAVLSFYVLNNMAFSPLREALNAAKKEVDNPLMALVYTGRNDEVGQLQLPAALLKARLRTVIGRIREQAVNIEDSAEKSAQTISEINQSIENQASKTELVATAMTEMTASVQEVANNTSYAAQTTHEADAYSKQGADQASGAAKGIEGLNKAVADVANVISQLVEDTQNIGTVIDVIRGVAEQTNLLALNAAIEAARAGEQGRGFAVVAEEVRTLAGRTQTSTEEINQLIEKLNEAVAEAVSVMERTQSEASVSEQNVTDAIESLRNIATQVGGLNDLSSQIATAVEQQSSVSEDINKNVVQISHGAEQVKDSSRDVMDIVSSLSHRSHEMRDMIDRFKQA